jgi:deoxyribonuclease-4
MNNNIRIGFHVSISGGISNSVDNALKIGCNAFQIFTRNPRGWAAKQLQDTDVESFKMKLKSAKIDRDSIFVHMPYLPNLSNSDIELHKKSTSILAEELLRSNVLGIQYLIVHLGSHGGKDRETGIDQLVKGCIIAFENFHKSSLPLTAVVKSKRVRSKQDGSVTILLENSAGHKNSIGSKFDELALILDKLNNSLSSSSVGSFGICLDTCHLFAAGYDLRTDEAVDETLDKFISEVGLKNLKLVHLNDSKDRLNSNRDRHGHIGLGEIGKKGFRAILGHRLVRRIPLIMETPVDGKRGDSDNLRIVLELIANKANKK